jgi:glycosyltransferase involved in cell wall biosynthesis
MPRGARLCLVIATKNRVELLRRAIASVLTDAYRPYRVIIVNDGSTDATEEFLRGITDSRVTAVNLPRGRGVNAARNEAFRRLDSDEWAVPLDDDDEILPGALALIARAIEEAPEGQEVIHFQTRIRIAEGEYVGGYQFEPGEKWHDQTYAEVMTKKNLRGDGRSAFRASLFSRYAYAEDVNGFESEFNMRLARDGVGSRYVPVQIMLLDKAHSGPHLTDTASREDPASFVRANLRIFRDHEAFFLTHPHLEAARALGALRVSLRAHDLSHAVSFLVRYFGANVRKIIRKWEKKK